MYRPSIRTLLGALAIGALTACGDGTTSPRPTSIAPDGPNAAITTIRMPIASYPTPQGNILLCKEANSGAPAATFTFNVSVDGGTATQLQVATGACAVAYHSSLPGTTWSTVVITEQGQTDWALADIDVTRYLPPPGGYTPPAGAVNSYDVPTATATLSVNSDMAHVVTFKNTWTEPATGQIGDFVWVDANEDGIQDSGEAGLAGALVTLTGPVSGSQTTGASGAYLFTNLPAGNYTVTVTPPAGYTPTLTGQGTPSSDNNGSPASVTLATASSVDLTIDFGYKPPPSGQIGDFVWIDTNANGIQDGGEPGLPGAVVTLSGPVSGSFTTTGSGAYLFTNLPAGAYTVTVTPPAGYTPTLTGQGTPATDNNGSPASVTLATNSSSDLTIDFGYNAPPPPPAGCTYTQGYWKTHSRQGPAPYDAGWKKIGPLEENTPFYSYGKTWLATWNTPVKGSKYLQLAHQYMAAKLNVLNGASAPSSVTAAIATAETYFSTGTGNITGLDTLLNDYNNGVIGPGHCN